MLIFLGGLQNIPVDLDEAGRDPSVVAQGRS
jgi:hypothetical protein